MTGLHRTDLTTSQKIQCAAQALAQQGEHGSKTRLSRAYEISRPTVYAAGETAEAVLRWHFEGRLVEGCCQPDYLTGYFPIYVVMGGHRFPRLRHR